MYDEIIAICELKDKAKFKGKERVLYTKGLGDKIIALFYQNIDGLSDEEIIKKAEEEDSFYGNLKNIGEVTISEEDDGTWLDNIQVDSGYYRNGIGTKFIELAVEHLGLDSIACVQESSSYKYSLTPEGEALIASCLNNKILSKNMCYFSGGVLLSDDNDGDPGLDSLEIREIIPGSVKNEYGEGEEEENQGENNLSDEQEEELQNENNQLEEEDIPIILEGDENKEGKILKEEIEEQNNKNNNILKTPKFFLKNKKIDEENIENKKDKEKIEEQKKNEEETPEKEKEKEKEKENENNFKQN